MIQAPFPTPPAADTVRVPLPDVFERWRDLYLHDASQKLAVFIALAVVFYLAARLARRLIGENIGDVNRRHSLKKLVGYAYAILLLLVAVALFADWLTGLGTVLAVLLAGVAVALQDVLKSIVGWFYVSSRTGIEPGSRIEVNGVVGDIVDVGVLKTTVLEVGNLVFGRQSSGRLVSIPNHRLLGENVHFSGAANPFVWNEAQVTITFESDWRRAESILSEIGREIYHEIEAELERGFQRMERRYAFKYGTRTPIVYVTLGESGIELTLRFLIHVRRRRGSLDQVSRRVLERFAAEPRVRLAYRTQRFYRLDEGAPGPAGSLHDDADPDARVD
jgi:small-conductance mechanosensitive channel